MTNKRALWLFAAALAAGSLATAFTGKVARAGSERRVATLAPDGSAWVKILRASARKVTEETDGRIRIKFYPGGVQGDEKDVVRKMRAKQLDGAALTTVGLSMIYPGVRVLQLPFLFDSVEEVDYVRAKMWPYLQAKFEEQGFRLLFPGDVGWTYLYTNRKIESMDDLRKVTFWAWSDDPIVKRLFKKLAIPSVPLGVPEVLGALKTNRIDGCYGSPLAAVALQWYTEVQYASADPVGYTVGAMVVRRDVWDANSTADRNMEAKINHLTARKLVKQVRRDNERARDAMKRSNVQIMTTPPALRARLRAAAEQVWKELEGEVYSSEEFQMVMKYRAEFRAQSGQAKSASN
jgi:TRAP-type transport system periplasmic protein